MIDVVFLLLVFFMLASRFGTDTVLSLPLAPDGGEYNGPPRLIDISPTQLAVNGVPVGDLVTALQPLMNESTDTLILRGRDGASLQRIVAVTEELRAAGMVTVVLVE